MKNSIACLVALMMTASAIGAGDDPVAVPPALAVPAPAPVALTEAEKAKAAADAKDAAMNQKINATNTSLQEVIDGFQFGAGVAAIFMQGDREVDATRVTDGKLYVDYKAQNRLGVILETHFLLGSDPLKTKEMGLKSDKKSARRNQVEYAFEKTIPLDLNDFAYGPMIAAELGDSALKSLGLGLMISFRRFHLTVDKKLEEKRAFNIGVAYLLEQDAKLLADGFGDGLALPAGSTDARFKKETREGIAVVFSATF